MTTTIRVRVPDLLDYTHDTTSAIRRLRPDDYTSAIVRYAVQPNEVTRACTAAIDVEDCLERTHALDELPAAFAWALRELDRVGAADIGSGRADIDDLGLLRELTDARAADSDATDAEVWGRTTGAIDALDEIRAALDPGGWGVTDGDLERIEDTLDGLNGPEADAVLLALSDEELGRLFHELPDTGWRDVTGWGRERRWEFLSMIGAKVSFDTWRRLGLFTEEIDPDPSTAISDAARERAERRAWYDELTYEEFAGTAFGRGTGELHAVDISDVDQGAIGDCYLITAMLVLARENPDAVRRMITENPNGTFTVEFADGTLVTVSPDFPVHPDRLGDPVFATNGGGGDVAGTELWPADPREGVRPVPRQLGEHRRRLAVRVAGGTGRRRHRPHGPPRGHAGRDPVGTRRRPGTDRRHDREPGRRRGPARAVRGRPTRPPARVRGRGDRRRPCAADEPVGRGGRPATRHTGGVPGQPDAPGRDRTGPMMRTHLATAVIGAVLLAGCGDGTVREPTDSESPMAGTLIEQGLKQTVEGVRIALYAPSSTDGATMLLEYAGETSEVTLQVGETVVIGDRRIDLVEVTDDLTFARVLVTPVG